MCESDPNRNGNFIKTIEMMSANSYIRLIENFSATLTECTKFGSTSDSTPSYYGYERMFWPKCNKKEKKKNVSKHTHEMGNPIESKCSVFY